MVSLTISLMRFKTYPYLTKVPQHTHVLFYTFRVSGPWEHRNSGPWLLRWKLYLIGSSLYFKQFWVFDQSQPLVEKKLIITHPKKIPSAKKTQDEIQNLRTKYARRSKFQHTESKHSTQPEPWTPAPEALSFFIRLSKDPNCESIADARFPSGGPPPPSFKICRNFCQGSYSASRFLALCP